MICDSFILMLHTGISRWLYNYCLQGKGNSQMSGNPNIAPAICNVDRTSLISPLTNYLIALRPSSEISIFF